MTHNGAFLGFGESAIFFAQAEATKEIKLYRDCGQFVYKLGITLQVIKGNRGVIHNSRNFIYTETDNLSTD